MDLNAEQLRAVKNVDGAWIVSAGPGTGKTRTLVHRVAHLLTDQCVAPQHLLAVTFTRSAAHEMAGRLSSLLAIARPSLDVARDLWIGTFHSIALRILRECAYPFGADTEMTILDEDAQQALIDHVAPRSERSALLNDIRRSKQQLLEPTDGPAALYQQHLRTLRQMDFDDVFLYACRLFHEQPDVAARYRTRFRYVLVDEFQDTSFAQYRFLSYLLSENVCVVGDPDQAIYGYANRRFRPFERFKTDHPNAGVLCLSENYRSQRFIVDAAKQVIEKNDTPLPRSLQARLEQGLPIEIAAHHTDKQEATLVVRRIEDLLGGASYFTIDTKWANKDEQTYAYGLNDIAILYRFHAQARLIEHALERAGLPYQTFGKKRKRNGAIVDAEENPSDIQASASPAPSVQSSAVTLMTLHRSKGLEFAVVFLVGCEDALLPYFRSENPEERACQREEERRLFYVGVTRAQSRLFLSHARKRFLFGKTIVSGPSPFLLDIDEQLRINKNSSAPTEKVARPRQPTLFSL